MLWIVASLRRVDGMVVIATGISGSQVRGQVEEAKGMLGKDNDDDDDVVNVFQSVLQLAC